jgi:hypothetical protein
MIEIKSSDSCHTLPVSRFHFFVFSTMFENATASAAANTAPIPAPTPAVAATYQPIIM